MTGDEVYLVICPGKGGGRHCHCSSRCEQLGPMLMNCLQDNEGLSVLGAVNVSQLSRMSGIHIQPRAFIFLLE